jgi:RNA polymerase sigma-70 factor (ECF subfamily)
VSIKELDRDASLGDDVAVPDASTGIPPDRASAGNHSGRPRVLNADAVKTNDQSLITECLTGRTEAFGQLVVRYQSRLYNTLVHVLGSADEAQDVAQDAFVHAFQKLQTFRGDSAFYSWLFRIALNAAVTRKRKNKRMKASLDAARDAAGIEPTDQHPSAEPSHALEQSERQKIVRQALSQLSEEFRTVLVLKEMEGLKYEEIADMVKCPIGTVRSRIHRARAELRQKLEILFRSDGIVD